MENTKHNLYQESLSAKINRYEQTIQELKTLNNILNKKLDRLTNK